MRRCAAGRLRLEMKSVFIIHMDVYQVQRLEPMNALEGDLRRTPRQAPVPSCGQRRPRKRGSRVHSESRAPSGAYSPQTQWGTSTDRRKDARDARYTGGRVWRARVTRRGADGQPSRRTKASREGAGRWAVGTGSAVRILPYPALGTPARHLQQSGSGRVWHSDCTCPHPPKLTSIFGHVA